MIIKIKIAAIIIAALIMTTSAALISNSTAQCSGQIGYEIYIDYTDGSHETIQATPQTIPTFQITPYSIAINGKAISSLTFGLNLHIISTKEILTISVMGNQIGELYKGQQTTPDSSSSITITKTGLISSKESTIQLLTTPIEASRIQQASSAGDWHLQMVATVTLDVNLIDGTTRFVTALRPVAYISYSSTVGTFSTVTAPYVY